MRRVIGLAVTLFLLAGCVNPTNLLSPQSGLPPGTASGSAQTTVPASAPSATTKVLASQTYTLKNGQGFSMETTLSVHESLRASAGYQMGATPTPVSSICRGDLQRDLIVPVTVDVKATTPDFATPLGFAVHVGKTKGRAPYAGPGPQPSQSDNRLRVARVFESGPDCKQMSLRNPGAQRITVRWDNPREFGGTQTHHFALIIKDYFAPATPEGDTALLDWVEISVQRSGGSQGDSMTFTVEDAKTAPALTLSGRAAP